MSMVFTSLETLVSSVGTIVVKEESACRLVALCTIDWDFAGFIVVEGPEEGSALMLVFATVLEMRD